MKNRITRLLTLSLIALVSACGGYPHDSNTSTGGDESSNTSINTSSSSGDDNREVRENELYTDAGLVVKFKAVGASIDNIKWNNTQIAKDGFVVGRCANRIAGGKFSIDGVEYNVDKNDNNTNSLHGGTGSDRFNSWRGPFATATWTKVGQTASTITYSIHSADGANGYPGNMDMTVKYTLSQAGELLIEYTATSDKDTLCNPTNHLYMNMNGDSTYNNLKLWVNANSYTPLVNQLPTGEIATVTGTQFDYSTEKAFDGSKDYDDNLVLNGEGYRKVATMTGTQLGMKVDVFTDRPGLQVYKVGNGSVCLESQMFPDAINHNNFESPILRANETFYSKTAYCFSPVEA